MNRPRLLFYFPGAVNANTMSGIGARVWRAVELTKDECDITLAVFDVPNWDVINTIYNTNIAEDDVKIVVLKPINVWWRIRSCFACYGPLDLDIGRLAKESDLNVSFSNFGHFGVAGIHFVVGFDVFNVIGIKGPRVDYWSSVSYFGDYVTKKIKGGAHHFMNFLKRVLRRDQIFLRKCKENGDVIVANSQWIASYFRRANLKTPVLYPPVSAEFSWNPFEKRKNAFVCIGRIHEIKKIEEMVWILKEVRRRTCIPFEFYIAGKCDDRAYSRFVRKLVNGYEWIKLVGGVSGEKKDELLTSCKYAIHACSIEAFGIAVAEYLKAGCIPFVHGKCGASEIINNDSLCFENSSDAVNVIVELLEKDESVQKQMQLSLLKRGNLFSLENYDIELLALIKKEIGKT